MKAKTYQIGLVSVTILLVVVGMILGAAVFHFNLISILICTAAACMILFFVQLFARRGVEGALNDERGSKVAGKAAYIAFRSFVIVGFIGMAVLMILWNAGMHEAGPAVGILGLSIGFISAIFTVAYFTLNLRT
jgi:uncharacterized membrane protein